MLRIIHYIENNPVAARLCRAPTVGPGRPPLRKGWAHGDVYIP